MILHLELDGIDRHYGKKIVSAKITTHEEPYFGPADALELEFGDGSIIHIFDNGQACCEKRFMKTDDDVSSLVGNTLLEINSKPGPTQDLSDENYEELHETCFIDVLTSGGFITITNHNEHNGYYGGFILRVESVDGNGV